MGSLLKCPRLYNFLCQIKLGNCFYINTVVFQFKHTLFNQDFTHLKIKRIVTYFTFKKEQLLRQLFVIIQYSKISTENCINSLSPYTLHYTAVWYSILIAG